MTEAEWGTWRGSPGPMLAFLRLRASDRKLRLFGCACCRLVWEHLPGDWARRAVEAAEDYADELLDEAARDGHRRTCVEALKGLRGAAARLGWAAAELVRPAFPYVSAMTTARLAQTGRGRSLLPDRQCDLLRDLFGNPFRRARLDPSPMVANLARTIYDERSFDRLPVLADALEEAGYDNPDLLAHCRDGGAHVRGCWVLDLLLDKE